MLQDFRYAVRMLAPSRGLAAVTILTLGLGIGASTAIFSVVDAVLLEPLPYPMPDRLVTLVSTVTQGTIPLESSRRFNAWRQQTQTFEDITAYTMKVSNLTGRDADQIVTFWTNESFFHLFGARMAHGRPFTVDEDRPGSRLDAVLTFGFWQRRFGAARTSWARRSRSTTSRTRSSACSIGNSGCPRSRSSPQRSCRRSYFHCRSLIRMLSTAHRDATKAIDWAWEPLHDGPSDSMAAPVPLNLTASASV